MFSIRKSGDRGHGSAAIPNSSPWLKSRFSFSFDRYYDPAHMQFGDLRVLNEDWIKGGAGFPTHPHANMEILTIVHQGTLEHRDSLGNHFQVKPGEIQRMSAGTGIEHSESNPDPNVELHLHQIWIVPKIIGLEPSYEQKSFKSSSPCDPWILAASGRQKNVAGLTQIHQETDLWIVTLGTNQSHKHKIDLGRKAWIQMIHGKLLVNGMRLDAGDGLAVSEESQLEFMSENPTSFLYFDLR